MPFDVVIPKEQQNPNLKTELEAEADGILAWCVAGCLEWQRQRLNPPESALAATAEYLKDEDTLGQWLHECCHHAPAFEERIAFLYESHRHWKQSRGEKPPSTKTFSQRMLKRGFRNVQSTTGDRAIVYQGLCLTDDEVFAVQARIRERKHKEQGEAGI